MNQMNLKNKTFKNMIEQEYQTKIQKNLNITNSVKDRYSLRKRIQMAGEDTTDIFSNLHVKKNKISKHMKMLKMI